jgi:hypothetical protein
MKTKVFSIRTLFVAGAGAVALAFILPNPLKWMDEIQESSVSQAVNPMVDGQSSHRAEPGPPIDQSGPFPATAVRMDKTSAQGTENYGGDLSDSSDPQRIYQALERFTPAEGERAIGIVSQRAEEFYKYDAIYKRLVELSSDEDPLVAERAQHARYRLMGLRAAHEISETSELDETLNPAWLPEAGKDGSQDLLETAVEPFDTLLSLALDEADPAVRLSGIEGAIRQSDEDGFYLLGEAALGDSDADNRLSAVSELEQMLKSGLGDSGQILQLLEDTAADSDDRVAELSKLILQERLSSHEEQPLPNENLEAPNEAGTAELEDLHETAAESFEAIRQQTLFDDDPAVRLSGIEAAIGQGSEDGFWLLSKAATGDYDPDNRLSAVSVFENLLKSGLGDRGQILQLLESTALDPDPRVAELSSLIIQEQSKSPEEQPQPDQDL